MYYKRDASSLSAKRFIWPPRLFQSWIFSLKWVWVGDRRINYWQRAPFQRPNQDEPVFFLRPACYSNQTQFIALRHLPGGEIVSNHRIKIQASVEWKEFGKKHLFSPKNCLVVLPMCEVCRKVSAMMSVYDEVCISPPTLLLLFIASCWIVLYGGQWHCL